MSEHERHGRHGPDDPDEPTRPEAGDADALDATDEADAEAGSSGADGSEAVSSDSAASGTASSDSVGLESPGPGSAGSDETDWPDRLLHDLNDLNGLNDLNDLTGNTMPKNGPDSPGTGDRTHGENDPAHGKDEHARGTDEHARGAEARTHGADALAGGGADELMSGADELALRRMMRSAVQELEPSDDALEHLRKAVPARRVRRRQAIVGMAAAALFVGTAIPAFVHVAKSDGAADERPAVAGHGQDTQGGTGLETRSPDGKKDERKPSGKPTSKGPSEKPDKDRNPERDAPAGGTSAGGVGDIGASGRTSESSPTCEPGQLGVSAGTGAPDADGKVYGTFRIANVSGRECAVAGTGSVNFQALGAADSGRIDVVEHTSGDAAVGLPDPSQEATGLVLAPDMAYEVKFAWVPTASCPTTEPSPNPSPTQTGETSEGTSGGTAGSGDSGQTTPETQLGEGDPPTEDGSIAVTHTPESGAPGAAANIPNACAGTIYRTGVLEAS